MSSLQAQIVEHLYIALLGRAPEAGAVEDCVAYLSADGTVDGLRSMIVSSEEYKSKQLPVCDHALAHIKQIWSPANISFFTHRGQYRPLSLTIETVNICNNDCVICPYSAQTRRKQTMSLDLFSDIVRQYTEIGGGPIGLTPMVGEIMLDKFLLERLEILSAAPAVTAISAISNASMVHLYNDAELAEILSHFDRLTISIYGLDAEEFQIMTQKEGYERFRDGAVRILAAMGPERVTLAARQLRHRTDVEVTEWAKSLALDARVDASKVHIHATRTYANWGYFDVSQPLPLDATWQPLRENSAQCALPLISFQVLSDGIVSFCGCANFDGTSDLNIGNVRETTLKSLMMSDRVRRLWNWEENGVPVFCRGCSFHVPIDVLAQMPQAFPEPLATFGG